MTPQVRPELQRLLSALCDGQLTGAEQARLEELLDSDAECRRHYLEYLDLHARLLLHPPLPGADTPPVPGRRWVAPQFLRYVVVAAGTLAASLLVQFLWRPAPAGGGTTAPGAGVPRPPGYVATLTRAAGCAWDGPTDPGPAGSRLPPGELGLRKGVARVRFDAGPELVVEGPAALRLDSATSATVLHGKVVFKGDETAAPFDLHTPASTLVDFGTEYAVAVGPDGEEVHVFDGEVRRTPRASEAEPEQLRAGQARHYAQGVESPGRPVPLDRGRFVRELAGPAPPDPAAGLLAYEGFDYKDRKALRAHRADGGFGWVGPWQGFARPLLEGDQNRLALDVREGLTRPGARVPPAGGCFEYTGFTKYYRRLATPVRLDADGVYYLSFLFRRQGPPADPLNAVAVLLRPSDEVRKEDNLKRLNVGVGGVNQLFTHLNRVGSRTPLPLRYGDPYLLVAKVVAGASNPDQVFMRVYAPEEPVEAEEPGSWTVTGPPFVSDLVFDWLEVHINSKTRQALDEVRLGTTWSSVAGPWAARGKP